VSLFGQLPRLKEIIQIAGEREVVVIEDAAQSFGATRNGVKSCGFCEISSTSFFPAKPFGCLGDGGALFTPSAEYAAMMRAIRSHGCEKRHHHTLVGMNGRLDTTQAAILLAKMKHFPNEVKERSEIGREYSEALRGVCAVPEIEEGNTHVYGQYTIRVPERAGVKRRLKEQGIPTAIYCPKCLHEQPVFSYLGYKRGSFPVSEEACEQVLSLPMHPFLSESDQDAIVAAVKGALTQK
jgi:UDP-2-acetamido-2-deoxy-ribo-hexuluronate aminotransferase